MKRGNAILIPLSLTLSHLGEGISGIPAVSGGVSKNQINKLPLRENFNRKG